MIFIHNKYTKWYYKIIGRATSRTLSDYYERHHIIPKSLGGSDLPDNIVSLTAREHFICHRLLVKMTTGADKSKMSQAAWMMVVVGKGQDRYKVNNRTYEKLRLEMSNVKKLMSTWNKGITPKDITRERLRKASLDYLLRTGKITQERYNQKLATPIGPVYVPKNPRKSKSATSKVPVANRMA